jgi:lipopolysaccharide/colanic/teichoic acid biosynthesis glycosyltransferase
VELYLWLPVLTEKLLSYNAARLPTEISLRALEQWQADLMQFPGSILKFLLALDLVRGRRKIIHEFYAPNVEFRHFMEVNIRILSLTYAIIKFWSSLPFMFLIGLCVKVESSGPIFIRLRRIGQGGHSFTQLKFRTVDISSDPPQLTMIGLVLERTGWVHLPFILNVLKGDMNLIGPLAFQAQFTEKNGLEKIPGFTTRYAVRPSLFTFTQICATKEDTPRRTIRYDMFYIRKRNLGLDLRLITRTFWDRSTRLTKRRWKQRVLPPLSKEAQEAFTSAQTLVKTLNIRSPWYLKGTMITSFIVYLVTFVGCWIYAIGTFSFFLGVGLALLLSLNIATTLATATTSLLLLIIDSLLGLSHNRAR